MTLIDNKINYIEGLVSLYHLLINADGHVDDKELKMGELMKTHEKIDDYMFDFYLNKISTQENEVVFDACVNSLNKCEHDWKVKCIAWMSLIANSDGFMDPEEWKLIYSIYNKELNLNLNDILEMQKQLPRPE